MLINGNDDEHLGNREVGHIVAKFVNFGCDANSPLHDYLNRIKMMRIKQTRIELRRPVQLSCITIRAHRDLLRRNILNGLSNTVLNAHIKISRQENDTYLINSRETTRIDLNISTLKWCS